MVESRIQIRRAEPSDIGSIVSLAHQLGYPESRDDMELRLERLMLDPDHSVLVAVLNPHGVIGWAHVLMRVSLLEEPMVEIGGLIVEQNHRRKGIGRKLIQAVEQWAQSKGCSRVVVRSNVVRKEAHDFYPNLGYQLSKTQRVYTKMTG